MFSTKTDIVAIYFFLGGVTMSQNCGGFMALDYLH